MPDPQIQTKVKDAPVAAPATALAQAQFEACIPAGMFSVTDTSTAKNMPQPAVFRNLESDEARDKFAEPVKAGKATLPISEAELHLERLKALRALLSGAAQADLDGLKKHLTESKKKVDTVFNENLKKVFAAQRPLEKSWRELDAFYKLARASSTSPVPVAILPIPMTSSLLDVARDDNMFEKFDQAVPKSTRLSMKDLKGLVVVPEWLKKPALLQKLGQVAQNGKALLVTAAPDKLETAKTEFGVGGDWAEIKGLEQWKEHVCMIGNPLRIREKLPKYETEDLYISPAIVFAGMTVRGDDTKGLASPIANKPIMLETPDASTPVLLWNLYDKTQPATMFNGSIVPVMNSDAKKLFYAVNTLSLDPIFKQYTTVRVREYIEKCLLQYLNDQAFMQNTSERRDALRDKVQSFLSANSSAGEDKMLEGGEVIRVESVAGDETKLDIELKLRYKQLAETMRIIHAENDGQHWDLKK